MWQRKSRGGRGWGASTGETMMCVSERGWIRENVKGEVMLRGVEVILEPTPLLNVVMRAAKGYESCRRQFTITAPLHPCVFDYLHTCAHLFRPWQ